MSDVLNRYNIKLNRNNKAICPFHTEKTPSFSVKGKMFYCFGCGEKGDSINFVQKIERCDFKEAISILGCEEIRVNKFERIENKRKKLKEKKYWDVYEQFAKFDLYCSQYRPKRYEQPTRGWLLCNKLRDTWWDKLQILEIK